MNDVTAVIPCYNDGDYILEAVDSLVSQTIQPDHIIIVDDGSAQETKDVLQQLDHPLIEIIYQENQGVASARNNGIKKATTTYILTLDADDDFEATFIEKAISILNDDHQTVAVCCYYQKHRNNKSFGDVIKPLGGEVADFLVKNNGLASAMFRRSRWEEIGGYDVQFKNGYEDWEFWIAMLHGGYSMQVIPEVLFNYRIKDTSRDQIAVAQYDIDLRQAIYDKYVGLYQKHADKVYSQMIYQNNSLRTSIVNLKQSKSYRLGTFLLKPIRFVKNLLN